MEYNKGMPAFADILVQIDAPGLEQPFTYRIPEGLTLEIGDPVLVPFGSQQAVGYVIGLKEDAPPEMLAKIKALTGRIENGIGFSAEQFALARWVAEQTLCDLRDAIRLIAPDVLTSQIKTIVHLTKDWEDNLASTRSEAQKSVAMALASLGGVAETSKLVRAGGGEQVGAILTALRRKNVIWEERAVSLPPAKQKKVRVLRLAVTPEIGSEEATRLERSGAAVQARLLRALLENEASVASMPVSGLSIAASAGAAARALAEKRLATYDEVIVQRDPFRSFGFGQENAPPLTDAQAKAAQIIGSHVTAQDGKTILLYGVTGSGKTEVYLDAVAQTLRQGKNALILLPEIGLTAQVLDLFKARFGADDVAVLHSALSLGERHDEWRRIQTGAARVVVGARSAVFAPVQNIGLMILDEEHDGSYKQDTTPRYHARDVAQQRAALTGAIVVLGSATPSVESYHNAQRGRYVLAALTERIDSRPLPPVEIIDLRAEFVKPKVRRAKKAMTVAEAEEAKATTDSDPPPPLSLFSKTLAVAITARLARREQTILFLNRRGFASFLLCRDCGFTFRCPNCDVSLTYHHAARLLQCHHCDYRRRPPDVCPKCEGLRLRPFGLGTEKVETGVAQDFPQARVLRMDRDTTARKGAHAEILRAFRRGEADILIGTQMVTKGLDFPNVTLVGVISADTALNVPDFRSAERAFQLLTQVAGRAGRGQTPGEVIVQTFTPEHESVCRAAEHDYLGFYASEIATREEVGYPPFAHLANLVFSDEEETLAQKRSHSMAEMIAQVREEIGLKAQTLGPVACPLSRLRGRYRWHLVVRCTGKPELLSLLRQTLARLTVAERTGLTIDIDPLTML